MSNNSEAKRLHLARRCQFPIANCQLSIASLATFFYSQHNCWVVRVLVLVLVFVLWCCCVYPRRQSLQDLSTGSMASLVMVHGSLWLVLQFDVGRVFVHLVHAAKRNARFNPRFITKILVKNIKLFVSLLLFKYSRFSNALSSFLAFLFCPGKINSNFPSFKQKFKCNVKEERKENLKWK